MSISLPSTLKEWVDEQVSRRGCGTASEFVRQVLREERERQTRERIDVALIAGLESGAAVPLTARDRRQIRAEGRRRASERSQVK